MSTMSRRYAWASALLALAVAATPALADMLADCTRGKTSQVALSACTQIIEDASASPADKAKAFESRGDARASAGAREDAVNDYTEALKLAPDDASIYAGRGQVRLARGDIAGAIADFDTAIRLSPKAADYRIARGHAHLVQGNADPALADFDAAITLNPKAPSAFNNRGLAYRKKGELDRAIEDYSAAILLNPLYALAYNNRGYAYEAKGQKAEAAADFRKALLADPALTGAKEGLKRLGETGALAAEGEALVREGETLAQKNCGWCHATGAKGESPNPKAPPFRTIQSRHPMLALREPLSRGIAAPHDEMPKFALTEPDIDRIIAYINSLKPAD